MRLLLIIVALGFFNCVQAQDDFISKLQDDLDVYQEKVKPLKIHLAFNQPQYVAGDTAYFAIHISAGNSNALATGRNIVTVKLAGPDGRKLYQQKILVTDGYGFNQFRIPALLPSGDYSVIVYSEAMGLVNKEMVYVTRLSIAGRKEREKYPERRLQFFPEGGSIVRGVTNRIVLTGPANTEGVILKSNGDRVTTFRLDSLGFSSVYVSIEEGHEYFAMFQGIRYSFPEIKDNLALLLSQGREQTLKAVVQVSEKSVLRDSTIHLVVSNDSKILYSAFFTFERKNSVILSIPQNNFPDGINRLTFLSSSGIVLAERLYFNRAPNNVEVEIKCKREYGVRELVSVNITAFDSLSAQAVPSTVSVSVINDDLYKPNMVDLPSLSLPDLVYHSEELSDQAIDNYLISKQDHRYAWSHLTTDEVRRSRYYNEMLTFRGEIKSLSDNVKIKDSTYIAFFVQNDVMGYQAYTLADGKFVVPLLVNFAGDDEVLYEVQQRGQVVDGVTVDLASEPMITVSLPQRNSTGADNKYSEFIHEKKGIDSAFHAKELLAALTTPPSSPTSFLEEEIFGADRTILLSDYILFPTMEETFREIVPFVAHRWHRGKRILRVVIDDERVVNGNPLLVIDGVMTDDVDYLMNLNPDEVYAIKIVNTADKLYTFGAIGRNGVLIVETKIVNNAENVRRSVHSFKVQGLNLPVTSFNSNRPEKNPRVPDLRLNLYWNPQVKVSDANGAHVSFTTSDVTGRFRIVVNGITADGRPLSCSKVIDVKYNAKEN